jgi:uncharacterized DUF497 family protein
VDVFIEILGIKFSWHDKKLRANERNHDGISLEEAADAFLDPDAMYTSAGDGHADGRQALIGKTRQASTLFVVQIEASDSDVLFISARHATADERKRYEARLY